MWLLLAAADRTAPTLLRVCAATVALLLVVMSLAQGAYRMLDLERWASRALEAEHKLQNQSALIEELRTEEGKDEE